MEFLIKGFSDPQVLLVLLTGVAVFATMFTLLMPLLGGSNLQSRMKSVAIERDNIKARERARLASETDRRRKGGSLKEASHKRGILAIVEGLDLKKALADENTLNKLRMAGFRGQNPLIMFLFLRFVLPFAAFLLAVVYIFGLGAMPEHSTMVKLFTCVCVAYAGFYAPNLYISNRMNKRKMAIARAWPDALDLLLICVESGISTEAGFRKVSDEIGAQSVELAEELVLTTAELSFLPERRAAYENLASRTGLDSVKSVTQALIQAERYGTPVATALRVLSAESREHRLNEAEKKAAALPPKLTVPMILFFLPVLFCVILGPAAITVSAGGGMFGDGARTNANP
ncbi:MAG: type II secretion system F family protein [Rhizobiaceae bacterium]